VAQVKLACGRVGDDGDGMAVQLLASAASWCVCMAWGIGSPTCRGGGVHVPRSRRVSQPTPQSELGEPARDRDLSFEAETCRWGSL
jgi:hypothetical protein